MPFEDIPEDREVSYPCDCGGSITLLEGLWSCDRCDFKREKVEEEDEI